MEHWSDGTGACRRVGVSVCRRWDLRRRTCFIPDPPKVPVRRSAFTLIEILLVVVIMLIASAMAVPSFIRSYRGAKLRTSARVVVMSHRFARGMAVLKQVNVAALYYQQKNQIEIVTEAPTSDQDSRSKFLEGRNSPNEALSGAKGAATNEAAAEPASINSEMIRPLADGVRITKFESDKAYHYKEVYAVSYYPNGMCDPYTVQLEDEYQKRAIITIDPMSGKAKVEYE